MRRPAALAVLVALIVLGAPPAAAQGYFGQTHVQYREFDWKVLKTEHFDVHYYPELEQVARYTGQMAERSYARLKRVLLHEFRERKPIIIYGSRGEFGQSNVLGDLGEGVGGATDPLRQRNMFFFTGDLGEAEHVLTHEMVHVFQFDVFARGRAGSGLQTLSQVNPPLWYMEGMAEYLSVGPHHPHTDAVMRDAALNGSIPSIEQMTQRPDVFFPYRFGESLWQYVGRRWGDETVGEIMQATPGLGIDRAFRRYTGLSLEDLSEEWKEDIQDRFLPQVAELDRPRRVAQTVLNPKRTGGIVPVYIAPVLSPDGNNIAYISTGSLLRAEVFLDLYLADVNTGKRLKRLTKSTLDPEFEELRYGYSQGAFSPDGRYFAFTAQRQGKDVLYVYDMRQERVIRRLDTGLQAMLGPSWSPDGRRLVFSGAKGGMSDLYLIDADGRNLQQLTDDPYGDLQPQWSPDGRYIVFASERGPQTDLETLRIGDWRMSVLDLQTQAIEVLPEQAGHNLNPMWSPDGRAIAFISDRTGIPQLFLWDVAERQHYQLTKFVGGITSMTKSSPAISWARQADKLAFTYQDDGDFTIWSITNPRQLKKEPFREPVPVVAGATPSPSIADTVGVGAANAAAAIARRAREAVDSVARARATDPRRLSVYRGSAGWRPSAIMEVADSRTVSVASLLDSATLALPDDGTFTTEDYRGKLRPEYVSRPQVGYAQDNFGRGVYGATAVVLTDMVGDKQLVLAGGINGRVSEAQVYAEYTRMGGRRPYSFGLQHAPSFFLTDFTQTGEDGFFLQRQTITRFIQRTAFASGIHPFNRFTRLEFGASLTNLDRANMYISQGIDANTGFTSGFFIDSIKGIGPLNFASPFVAYVSDNALFGATGGIYGRRYRFQVEQIAGNVNWTQYSFDYRRYDAILFNFLTLASRVAGNLSIGPDEAEFPKYIGRPDFIRGYDRELFASADCGTSGADPTLCSATQLLGSRVAYANVELRFPLIRRFDLGLLPIALPPLDGLAFYDFGMAWTRGQDIHLTRPDDYDFVTDRYPLRSYGLGLRLNLYNFAMLRWDYAVPRDAAFKRGYWFFTLGQSF